VLSPSHPPARRAISLRGQPAATEDESSTTLCWGCSPSAQSGLVPTDGDHETGRTGMKRLIDVGADLVGSSTGAAVGLAMAGPVGAMVGAAAGPLLTNGIKDFAERTLSRRERIRVDTLCGYTAEAIIVRKDAGDRIRDDGFFFAEQGKRSSGEELFEAVLIAAQREHEERKVEYLGYLFANLCFEEEVDRSLANWIIKIAQELTWTQLVLLSLVGQMEKFDFPDFDMEDRGSTGWRSFGLRDQLVDLSWSKRAMIGASVSARAGQRLPRISTRFRDQRLQAHGQLLFGLMQLEWIPLDDIEDVLQDLLPEPDSGVAEQSMST